MKHPACFLTALFCLSAAAACAADTACTLFLAEKAAGEKAYRIVFSVEIPQEIAFAREGRNGDAVWSLRGSCATGPRGEKDLSLKFEYKDAKRSVRSFSGEVTLQENPLVALFGMDALKNADVPRSAFLLRCSAAVAPPPTPEEIAAAIEKITANLRRYVKTFPGGNCPTGAPREYLGDIPLTGSTLSGSQGSTAHPQGGANRPQTP